MAISIHALVKRATFKNTHNNIRKMDFNPRPREKGDAAPANVYYKTDNFNPRPREKGDCAPTGPSADEGNFNPRPREKGD